jgi:hypothetical protein
VPREATAPDLSLDRIQRWMQAVIVDPGSLAGALASAAAAAEIPAGRLEEVVRPSWSLSAAERVEIYHDMYLMRMVEALEADYPALRHLLGAARFAGLVRDYVGRHPSRSYTLNRLGDHLPLDLRERSGLPHAAFLGDLAAAELAITEVFDADETEVLQADALAAVPAEAWPGVRLRPVAAFRLLALEHAVTPHLEAARRGTPPPPPARRRSWLAVVRRDLAVVRLDLERAEYRALSALAAGAPVATALAAAGRAARGRAGEAAVAHWFRRWFAAGMFAAVEP